MMRRIKIKGSHRLRKKTDRELNPVNKHDGQEAKKKGKGCPMGRNESYEQTGGFPKKAFKSYLSHDKNFWC
jgi:hypothetical protein